MRVVSRFSLISLAVLGIAYALFAHFSVGSVSAQSCTLYNATERIFRANDVWGARADIYFTNPSIPTQYSGSYHRVAVSLGGGQSGLPFRYYEFGWAKVRGAGSPYNTTIVAWTDPATGFRRDQEFSQYNITGSNNYQVRYVAAKNKWRSFFNGVGVYGSGKQTGFGVGSRVIAGGEALCGTEGFGCVLTYNLQTRGYFGTGTLQWQDWSVRLNYVDNPPYNNQETALPMLTRFYSHHNSNSCSAIALPPLSPPNYDDPGDGPND